MPSARRAVRYGIARPLNSENQLATKLPDFQMTPLKTEYAIECFCDGKWMWHGHYQPSPNRSDVEADARHVFESEDYPTRVVKTVTTEEVVWEAK